MSDTAGQPVIGTARRTCAASSALREPVAGAPATLSIGGSRARRIMTTSKRSAVWTTVAAGILLSSLGAADAFAASCKQTDLKGEWLVELSTDAVCDFEIDKKGGFKNAPCKPQRGGSVQGTASGKLTVNASCKVSGNMAFKQKSGPTLNISVKATLNKGKDLMAGNATSQFGSATFKGFKQ